MHNALSLIYSSQWNDSRSHGYRNGTHFENFVPIQYFHFTRTRLTPIASSLVPFCSMVGITPFIGVANNLTICNAYDNYAGVSAALINGSNLLLFRCLCVQHATAVMVLLSKKICSYVLLVIFFLTACGAWVGCRMHKYNRTKLTQKSISTTRRGARDK